MRTLWIALCVVAFAFPVSAQELVPDTIEYSRAEVVTVHSSEERLIPGTDTPATYQEITVRILDGAETGKEVQLSNDYLALDEGDVFYLSRTTNTADGTDYYTIGDPYRLPWLFGLACVFLAVVAVFGGKQGMRGILSLGAGIAVIIGVLLPAIQTGYSPVLVSVGVTSLIVIIGSYVTHGVSRMTTTAVLGMIATIVLTGILAHFSLLLTQLTGFTGDESTYLHLNSRGELDLLGLLLGGILIGLIGVMYDAAIGQSVAVEELYAANPSSTGKHVYLRALRIGREHIGALVNTLAIAYVGASLPLLLLFYGDSVSWLVTLNREIFAAEIVRILVSSIGVILVVPITTALAVLLLAGSKNRDNKPDSIGHLHHHV